MKLSLLTYNMARTWELPKVIEMARAGGFAGIEFRAEANHKHGVELDTTAEQRREIRDRIQDGYLEIACIGLSSRFDTPNETKRREIVERSKQYADLAAAVGCRRLRVFGNDMPKQGVEEGSPPPDRDTVIAYVADALLDIASYAEPRGVEVLLEMHGQFNYWHFARRAIEIAGHPGLGIVYNCDNRDLVAGSVASTYERVRHLVRHVHMHAFTRGYPYPELFGLLQRDGYTGYLSSEIDAEVPTSEDYLLMYAQLFRAWAALGAPFQNFASMHPVAAGIPTTAPPPRQRG
jgi:sugar phosphate isomerase/epimerase